ncbi:MAG TPA: hypothetical protein EYN62_01345, partial [Gammaproteobacteria bacterium]|nr:hypothetical protein [Gammaproteobacteria bacterium]
MYIKLNVCIDFNQLEKTYQSFVGCVQNKMNDEIIKYQSELFIAKFKLLLQLVNDLEKGNAAVLYQSYSPIKEKIYQHLHKQYQYEHRLISMRAEQEEMIKAHSGDKLIYIKEKIQALKIRLQKCNTFTQKLEFQLEALNNDIYRTRRQYHTLDVESPNNTRIIGDEGEKLTFLPSAHMLG